MGNRIQNAFGNIQAEDTLKTKTTAFLCEKIHANKTHPYRSRIQRFSIAFATSLIMLFVARYAYILYYTASTFVDIDVNPAIELSLNRFDRIIGAYAYNADGEEIITDLNLMCKKYDYAVSLIVDQMINRGYIIDDGIVSVTVQSSDNNKETVLLNSLQNSVSLTLKNLYSATEVEIYSVDSDIRMLAHDMNITPAKYLAIVELQKANPSMIMEECVNHSISELRDLATEHANQHHEKDVNDGNNNHEDSKDSTNPDPNGVVNEHTINTPSSGQQFDEPEHGYGHH